MESSNTAQFTVADLRNSDEFKQCVRFCYNCLINNVRLV